MHKQEHNVSFYIWLAFNASVLIAVFCILIGDIIGTVNINVNNSMTYYFYLLLVDYVYTILLIIYALYLIRRYYHG